VTHRPVGTNDIQQVNIQADASDQAAGTELSSKTCQSARQRSSRRSEHHESCLSHNASHRGLDREFVFFSSLSAEDKPDTRSDEKSDVEKLASRRLEFMKNSVTDYEFLLGPDFKAKLTVEPEPLLRFTNSVSGLQDGGFFLWKSETGRPMVGAQVF